MTGFESLADLLDRAEMLAPWMDSRIENIRGAFRPGGRGDKAALAHEVAIAERRMLDRRKPVWSDIPSPYLDSLYTGGAS